MKFTKIRYLYVLLALMGIVLTVPACTQKEAPKEAPKTEAPVEDIKKVVYLIDFYDTDRVSATLTSVNNMVNVYQESLQEYDVRIVFLGAGIRYTTEDPMKGTPFEENKEFLKRKTEILERVISIKEAQDVKLELCDITRVALNLDKEKLLPGIELVKSGVVRIAELQEKGFAFIKIR